MNKTIRNFEVPENCIIEKIEEKTINPFKSDNQGYIGLEIITNKGKIILSISDDQDCCEIFDSRFLEPVSEPREHIGSQILEIREISIEAEDKEHCSDEGGYLALEIKTEKGSLVYQVYNEHNGYYSHGTFLQVFEYTEEDSL